jgi:hypothetical protein
MQTLSKEDLGSTMTKKECADVNFTKWCNFCATQGDSLN